MDNAWVHVILHTNDSNVFRSRFKNVNRTCFILTGASDIIPRERDHHSSEFNITASARLRKDSADSPFPRSQKLPRPQNEVNAVTLKDLNWRKPMDIDKSFSCSACGAEHGSVERVSTISYETFLRSSYEPEIENGDCLVMEFLCEKGHRFRRILVPEQAVN